LNQILKHALIVMSANMLQVQPIQNVVPALMVNHNRTQEQQDVMHAQLVNMLEITANVQTVNPVAIVHQVLKSVLIVMKVHMQLTVVQ
jgi:hypothetical protein